MPLVWSDKVCKRGHVGLRYSNGNCRECLLERERAKQADPQFAEEKRVRERNRWATSEETRKRGKKNASTWRAANLAAALEASRKRYEENKAEYIERNSGARAHPKATVPWSSRAERIAVYEECARRKNEEGIDYTVDHIVPLNGATVSGLHCVANLEIKTRADNSSKGSRWWPDMFENESERPD